MHCGTPDVSAFSHGTASADAVISDRKPAGTDWNTQFVQTRASVPESQAEVLAGLQRGVDSTGEDRTVCGTDLASIYPSLLACSRYRLIHRAWDHDPTKLTADEQESDCIALQCVYGHNNNNNAFVKRVNVHHATTTSSSRMPFLLSLQSSFY